MTHHREQLKKSIALHAAVIATTVPGKERRERVDEIMQGLYHGAGTALAIDFIDRLEEGVDAHFSFIRLLAREHQVASARFEAERYDRLNPEIAKPCGTHPVFGYIEIAQVTGDEKQVHFALTRALKMKEWEVGNRVDALVQIAAKLNHPEALEKALDAARGFEEDGDWLAASEAYRLIALSTHRAEHWASSVQMTEKLEGIARSNQLAVVVNDMRTKCGAELVEATIRLLPDESEVSSLLGAHQQ